MLVVALYAFMAVQKLLRGYNHLYKHAHIRQEVTQILAFTPRVSRMACCQREPSKNESVQAITLFSDVHGSTSLPPWKFGMFPLRLERVGERRGGEGKESRYGPA